MAWIDDKYSNNGKNFLFMFFKVNITIWYIIDRVQNRKKYFEITTFLYFKRSQWIYLGILSLEYLYPWFFSTLVQNQSFFYIFRIYDLEYMRLIVILCRCVLQFLRILEWTCILKKKIVLSKVPYMSLLKSVFLRFESDHEFKWFPAKK